MPRARGRTTSWLPLFLIAIISTGCNLRAALGGNSLAQRTPVGGPASPTPFQPVAASPTPAVITLWASPNLPLPLLTAARRLSRVGPIPVSLENGPDRAEIRLAPFADVPLTSWTFALAAPFPTLEDGTTLQDLKAVWNGEGGPVARLLVSAESATLLKPILGEASATTVELVDERDLSGQAWRERPAWALLPFEALDPTWKVLAVDGQSPIGDDFNPDAYPLIVPIGMSGGSLGPELLAGALGWPAGNRDPNRLTSVLITGVTAITRGVAWRIEASGYAYPAELIGAWLRSADFTHVSQEIAFTHDCPPPDPYQPTLRFCGDPDHFPLLQEAGVDLVELSGNHILDWGRQPFL
ncbi:MAG: CapA family protein, partial [Anaerolineales bacterium]